MMPKKKTLLHLPDFKASTPRRSGILYSVSYFLGYKFFWLFLQIQILILRIMKREFIVLTNHYFYNLLSKRLDSKNIICYERFLEQLVEKASYDPYHKYADAITLAHSNGAAFYIFETRWLWQYAYNDQFLLLIKKLIDDQNIDRYIGYSIGRWGHLTCKGAKESIVNIGIFTSLIGAVARSNYKKSNEKLVINLGIENFKGKHKYLEKLPTISDDNLLRSNKTILIIVYFQRSLDRVFKLIERLHADNFQITIAAISRVDLSNIQRIYGNKISTFYFGDWITKNEYDQKIVSSDINHKCNNGFDSELCSTQWETLEKCFLEKGASIANIANIVAERVVNKILPSVVLSFEDWEMNRAINQHAAKRNIPTIGYYCLSPNSHAGLIRRSHKYLAVSGEVLRDQFSSQYNNENIRVVGDVLAKSSFSIKDQKIKFALRNQWGIDSALKVILILCTYDDLGKSESTMIKIIRRTMAALDLNANYEILVRPHPAQSKDDIIKLMHCAGVGKYRIFRDCDLYEAAFLSDLISTSVTSAVFTAMLAGTPVVSFQDANELIQYNDDYQYLNNMGVVHIGDAFNSTSIVQEYLMSDEVIAKQIKLGFDHATLHAGLLKGDSSNRLVKFIEHCMAANKMNVN